jgi:uncharacterized protein (DUF2235 family)
LIHVYGLLCPGNQGCIPYILDMYSKNSRKAKHQIITFKPDRVFQWQFSHKETVRIHFCGLWDTVSTYGWVYDPIALPFLGSNPIIHIGRHAISLDERRCFYQDNPWGAAHPGQDIRQVWFRGVHSDVGGSYPEHESGLSKIALEWMLIEAEKAGLLIDCRRAETVLGRTGNGYLPNYVQPDKNATVHQSLKGSWWLLELLPQKDPHKGGGWRLPLGRKRVAAADAIIHESVVGSDSFPTTGTHPIEPWIRYGGSRGVAAMVAV